MALTAEDLYGVPPSPQPDAIPMPTQPAGEPSPSMRTLPRPSAKGLAGDPIFVLVAILGLAFLIAHLSVRLSLGVST